MNRIGVALLLAVGVVLIPLRDFRSPCLDVRVFRPTHSLALRARISAFFPKAALSNYFRTSVLLAIEPPGDDEAVESARSTLEQPRTFPWYDAEQDGLRRIELPDDDSDAAVNRGSDYEYTPRTTPVRPTGWSWLGGTLRVVAWTVLALLLVLVAGLLGWAFTKREAPAGNIIGISRRGLGDGVAQRIEKLPFAVESAETDLLTAARRSYEAGDLRAAIIFLFSYQLVELDHRQLIRLARGKTNRQYLREVWRRPRLYQLVEYTMIAFEDVFFGNHRLERERFETCWHAVDDFQRLVEQPA